MSRVNEAIAILREEKADIDEALKLLTRRGETKTPQTKKVRARKPVAEVNRIKHIHKVCEYVNCREKFRSKNENCRFCSAACAGRARRKKIKNRATSPQGELLLEGDAVRAGK